MLNEARQRLANVARDPSRYSALMDGLVLQVSRYISDEWFDCPAIIHAFLSNYSSSKLQGVSKYKLVCL